MGQVKQYQSSKHKSGAKLLCLEKNASYFQKKKEKNESLLARS